MTSLGGLDSLQLPGTTGADKGEGGISMTGHFLKGHKYILIECYGMPGFLRLPFSCYCHIEWQFRCIRQNKTPAAWIQIVLLSCHCDSDWQYLNAYVKVKTQAEWIQVLRVVTLSDNDLIAYVKSNNASLMDSDCPPFMSLWHWMTN